MRHRRTTAALAALLFCGVVASTARAATSDPGTTTPVEHMVVLIQENHSFDNYFGTYPGANGIPEGACMPVDPGRAGSRCIKPEHIGDEGSADLPNTVSVFRHQFNDGKMNGFLSAIRRQTGEVLPQVLNYYDERDIPYYWSVARNYTLFDRFFAASRGGSLSNHMYSVAAQPGISAPAAESIPPGGFTMPTIFDRLQARGISWKYYVENYDPAINFRTRAKGDPGSQTTRVPLLDFPRFLDRPGLAKHIVPIEQYYRDLAAGTLPAVSYIAPSASSEHPPGGPAAGQSLVRSLIGSLMASREWSSSAFLWTYDNWGGFYDHVRPPRVDRFGYGFRVPALLVSPYSPRGAVEHSTLDSTSILRFIEDNWNLKPLARRDRSARSIGTALDFQAQPREPVILNVGATQSPKEPRRAGAYLGYGIAIAAFLVILAGAAGRLRRPRTQPKPGTAAP